MDLGVADHCGAALGEGVDEDLCEVACDHFFHALEEAWDDLVVERDEGACEDDSGEEHGEEGLLV